MSKDPQRTRLVKWWPIGFAIAAVIFFVIGAALLGTYFNSSYSSCDDYYYSYYSSSYCYDGNNGEFYGGIACIVIGGILKLVAWILFIIWCVKRNRIQQNKITFINNAPAEAPQQQYAAPQPMYPMQPGATYAPSASPGPGFAEAAGTPSPKEGVASATAYKYCSQCGVAAHGRFCSQCGTQC
ncbi:uncharacterized protein N7484_010539 [Penicillium longicatenatum]|uniref:uncharacterized protein n=1 Tax=Penicillium longicatenatum TaxID=1561947 RepID=UPI002547455B|nr:uncharacterized protein N7484_010539 [Penicillium longicatenatum]KAJ5630439.1 hypothetical protein N7484_010539 [Penicillium longicatenatum]